MNKFLFREFMNKFLFREFINKYSCKRSCSFPSSCPWSGGGRRPCATTISSSVPHICFFFSSGSHDPPLFPLLYHHIFLFRTKLLFEIIYLGPLNCDFQGSMGHAKNIYSFHKKWLIFESTMNIKMIHHEIYFSFKRCPCVKMCNVLRENC